MRTRDELDRIGYLIFSSTELHSGCWRGNQRYSREREREREMTIIFLDSSAVNNMLKAVILIGSPQKGNPARISFVLINCNTLGTRFRPLSFEIPKPLFPIAGYPILSHLIESCVQVTRLLIELSRPVRTLRELREILLIGCYQPNEALSRFIANAQQTFGIAIRFETICVFSLDTDVSFLSLP
jgi:hypothetical protein